MRESEKNIKCDENGKQVGKEKMRWTGEGKEICLLLVKSKASTGGDLANEIKSHRIFISPAGLSKAE